MWEFPSHWSIGSKHYISFFLNGIALNIYLGNSSLTWRIPRTPERAEIHTEVMLTNCSKLFKMAKYFYFCGYLPKKHYKLKNRLFESIDETLGTKVDFHPAALTLTPRPLPIFSLQNNFYQKRHTLPIDCEVLF